MNKLIFDNKEYELVEIEDDRFRFYSKQDLSDIGYNNLPWVIQDPATTYEIYVLRIKDKLYGLKPIDNE